MNWLSHIFISKNAIAYQLGNVLADPLKGKYWQGASKLTREGFKMHCKIDSYTDANMHVLKSKSRLAKKGYLKGVIIDITYDYLLLNNWHRYSHLDISVFINKFYADALTEINHYPKIPQQFIKTLIESKNLTSYATFEGLEAAFQRIDSRLSTPLLAKESATSYLPIVKKEIDAIQQDFDIFFPQLITYFKQETNHYCVNHWLK